MNAVNSGMMVTVPAEEVTMGDWSGTGYIVTNPETGVGKYMISGGLNGGSVSKPVTTTYLLAILYSIVMLAGLFSGVTGIVHLLVFGGPIAALVGLGLLFLTCVAMICVVLSYIEWTTQYMDYMLEGDEQAALDMMYGVASDTRTYSDVCLVFGGLSILNQCLNSWFGANLTDVVENIGDILRKYTNQKIIDIIMKHGISVEEFSELLQYGRVLTSEEAELVNVIRNEIGEVPAEGTEMIKIIPEKNIYKYLQEERDAVSGFVSESQHSETLKTFEEVFEGNRLDYKPSDFSLSDGSYGKIRFKYEANIEIEVPRTPATANDYPYTGRGFTASERIILPEWKITEKRKFIQGDILEIYDRNGKLIEVYEHDGKGWNKQ